MWFATESVGIQTAATVVAGAVGLDKKLWENHYYMAAMEFHRVEKSFHFRHPNEWTEGIPRILLWMQVGIIFLFISIGMLALVTASMTTCPETISVTPVTSFRCFVCARPIKTSARNCLARVIPSRPFNR